MNDFYDSTASRCVQLVDKHAPKLMSAHGALTPVERARLLRDRSIISIAPPTAIKTLMNKKYSPEWNTGSGVDKSANIAAFQETVALGAAIKRGDALAIIRKHNAHEQTVYKMLFNARGKKLPQNQKKAPGICSHWSCTRQARPGFKCCEHHAELQRTRSKKFYDSTHETKQQPA